MTKAPWDTGYRGSTSQEDRVEAFLNDPKNWTLDMILNYMANSGLWLEYGGDHNDRTGERLGKPNDPNTKYWLRGMADMPAQLAGNLPLSEWQQFIYQDYKGAIGEAKHQAELGNPQAVTDFLLSTGDPTILNMMGKDPEASEEDAEATLGASDTGTARGFPDGLRYDIGAAGDGVWMYYNQPLEGLAKQVGASDWIKDLWNRLAAYGEISDDAEAATYATNTVLALGPEPTAGVGGTGFAIIDGSQIPGGKPGERWFIGADGRAYRVDEAPDEGPDIEGEIGRLILEGSPESIARARELWTLRNDIMNAPMSREDAQIRASKIASNPDEYMAWMNALYNMPGSQMQDIVDGEVVTTPDDLGTGPNGDTGSQVDGSSTYNQWATAQDGDKLPAPSLTSEDFTADEELGTYPVLGATGVGSPGHPSGGVAGVIPAFKRHPEYGAIHSGMPLLRNPQFIPNEDDMGPDNYVTYPMGAAQPPGEYIPLMTSQPNHPAFNRLDRTMEVSEGPRVVDMSSGYYDEWGTWDPTINPALHQKPSAMPNHPAFGARETLPPLHPAHYAYTNDDSVVIQAKEGEFITKAPNDITANITQGNPNGGRPRPPMIPIKPVLPFGGDVYLPNYDTGGVVSKNPPDIATPVDYSKYVGPAGDMSGKTPNRPGGGGGGSTNTGQGSQSPTSMVAHYFDQPDSFANQNPQSFQNSYGTGTMQQFASLPKIGLSGGGSLYPGSQDIPYGSTGERLAQLQAQFYARAKSMGMTDEQAAHWASQQSALFDMAERERRIAAQQRFVRLGPRRTRYA